MTGNKILQSPFKYFYLQEHEQTDLSVGLQREEAGIEGEKKKKKRPAHIDSIFAIFPNK